MIWFLEGLGLMRRNLSRSALLALCWTLALLVAGLLGWALENSLRLREALVGRVPAEVYLAPEDGAAATGVMDELSRCRSLRLAGLLGRDEAAAEFRQGFGVDVVELLGENPFPLTVLLKVRADADPLLLERELARLRQLPGVEGVHVDRALLGNLGLRLRQAGRAGIALGLLLALLTLALLAAAVRSIARSWEAEARLLTLQGARPGLVALPVLLSLMLPALTAVGMALLGLLSVGWLARELGMEALSPAPVWPVWVGGAIPMLAVWFILRRRREA